MRQDEFNRLFTYMSKRFDHIDAALEVKADRRDLDGVYEQLDGILSILDDSKTEQAAQQAQLNRHERWHREISEQIGLTFE